ncbi:MAG: CAP domain-containing protein [Phycisphaerae bacterium]
MTRKLTFSATAVWLLGLTTGCFWTDEPALDAGQDVAGAAARCITPEDAERMADQVVQLVNLARTERGLQPVVVNAKLEESATEYACKMANEGFFGHRDPITGHGPARRAVASQYKFYAVGENLAAGQETPADVMKVWMESPPHRDLILGPNWEEVGVAVRTGGEHSIYWVQEFGEPADY